MPPTDAVSKPQCGGDAYEAGEYNVGLHVLGLFLVLALSLFGAAFPVVTKRTKQIKFPARVFFVCKHFGTGVLIATAFIHLLPTAFKNLTNPCLPDLFTEFPPMPGVIMMASLFAMFALEMWIHGKVDGHSCSHAEAAELELVPAAAPSVLPLPLFNSQLRGGSRADTDDADAEADKEELRQRVLDPNWKATQQAIRLQNPSTAIPGEQHAISAPSRDGHELDGHRKAGPGTGEEEEPIVMLDSQYVDTETGLAVDPAVHRKLSLNVTLLEGGILFHSVFVGMTLSLTADGFVVLLVAVLFHQLFEGLGLGARIAAVPVPRARRSVRAWLLVAAFGLTAPLGQAIGLGTRLWYDPESALGLIVVGAFDSISAGLLIYAALVDLLAGDFLSEDVSKAMTKKDRVLAFMLVLAGAAGMTVVGVFA